MKNLTMKQIDSLRKNNHLVPITDLGDGDILVLDKQDPKGETRYFGPYVLTVDGYIQDVQYHYKYKHGLLDLPYHFGEFETIKF